MGSLFGNDGHNQVGRVTTETESMPPEGSTIHNLAEGMKKWMVQVDIPTDVRREVEDYLIAINKHPAMSNIRRGMIPDLLDKIRYIRQLLWAGFYQRAITELMFLAYELDLNRAVDAKYLETAESHKRTVEVSEHGPSSRGWLSKLTGSDGE